MELIDLQDRTDLKAKYMEISFGDFYRKYLDQDKFPNSRKFMASKMRLFGSIYLCEQFFSKSSSHQFKKKDIWTFFVSSEDTTFSKKKRTNLPKKALV